MQLGFSSFLFIVYHVFRFTYVAIVIRYLFYVCVSVLLMSIIVALPLLKDKFRISSLAIETCSDIVIHTILVDICNYGVFCHFSACVDALVGLRPHTACIKTQIFLHEAKNL